MNDYVENNSDNELPLVGSELDAHMKTDDFSNVHVIDFDFEITASPAELAAGNVGKWKLMPHLSSELKQNLATKNRHLASGEDLAGNLDRFIPLDLKILQQKNSFPFAMGVKINGMMDKNLHRTGKCVYRVAPDTQTMVVGHSVFEPTNFFSRHLYEGYRACTLEDLENDVKFFPKTSKAPAHAMVQVGSLAHEAVIKNLEEGRFQREVAKRLIDVDEIRYPPEHMHNVKITEGMGKGIVGLLKPGIEEAIASMINLENFEIEAVRADGHAFNKPTGLHGQLVGSDLIDTGKVGNNVMQIRHTIYLKCQLAGQFF